MVPADSRETSPLRPVQLSLLGQAAKEKEVMESCLRCEAFARGESFPVELTAEQKAAICKKCRIRVLSLRWRSRNQGKRRAHQRVAWALKWGQLRRPDTCEWCDKQTIVVAHHPDYRSYLKVNWICDSCHRKHHASKKRK